jgi:hypothetical protein
MNKSLDEGGYSYGDQMIANLQGNVPNEMKEECCRNRSITGDRDRRFLRLKALLYFYVSYL